MKKIYKGFSLPSPVMVRYSIDWRCAVCGSEKVTHDPNDNRHLTWCDGRPCTEDQLRRWSCETCGAIETGRNMSQEEAGFEVLYSLVDRPE